MREGYAALAASLPELDGIRVILLGLQHTQGGSALHVLAQGRIAGAPARAARHRPELPAVALAQGQRRPVARRPPGPLPPGRPGERDPAAAGAAADPPHGLGRGAGRRPVGRGPRHAAAALEVPVVTGSPNGPWFTPCRRARRWCRAARAGMPSAGRPGSSGCPGTPTPRRSSCWPRSAGRRPAASRSPRRGGRHLADLTVLGIGPRGPADEITVSWDDVDAAAQAARAAWAFSGTGRGRLASPPRAAMARAAIRRQQHQAEAGQASQRRLDMLSLLALGTGFQVRLAGQVVAAHADRLDEPDEHRADHPVGADRRPGRPARAGGRAVARHRPGPGGGVVVTAGPGGVRSS